MSDQQNVDLYGQIVSSRVGAPPLTLRVGVRRNADMLQSGVPQQSLKVETYVLMSVLPADLQEKIKLVVQTLIAGT